MFGEFSGAVGAAYGPQSGSESRMSSSILPVNSVDPVAISQPHCRGGPTERSWILHSRGITQLRIQGREREPAARHAQIPRCTIARDHQVSGDSALDRPLLGLHLAFSKISTSRQRLV